MNEEMKKRLDSVKEILDITHYEAQPVAGWIFGDLATIIYDDGMQFELEWR